MQGESGGATFLIHSFYKGFRAVNAADKLYTIVSAWIIYTQDGSKDAVLEQTDVELIHEGF